jgi:signal transduction histidine kinase
MPKGHLPVTSYLAGPVTSSRGEVLGGLFFGHEKPNVFTERHERLLMKVAAQVAIAIDNARLYEQAVTARAEAERASQAKDNFLAAVSHELRTPLTSIYGWSSILRSPGFSDPDRLEKGLETIQRNSQVLAKLIDDLLDLSRVASGTLQLELKSVSLNDVVQQAVLSVSSIASVKGVKITVGLDDHSPPIQGDPQRLQQVVWNLVGNAVKFTPRGGTVEIRTHYDQDSVQLVVNDTGMVFRASFFRCCLNPLLKVIPRSHALQAVSGWDWPSSSGSSSFMVEPSTPAVLDRIAARLLRSHSLSRAETLHAMGDLAS